MVFSPRPRLHRNDDVGSPDPYLLHKIRLEHALGMLPISERPVAADLFGRKIQSSSRERESRGPIDGRDPTLDQCIASTLFGNVERSRDQRGCIATD